MDIEVLAQVFYHQSFQVQVTFHSPINDTLHGGGYLAENAQFLAAIVKPGTLEVRHSELKLGHKFVVHIGDGGGGEAVGREDGEGAAFARHHILTVTKISVLTSCSVLGGTDGHFIVWFG